MLFDLLENGRDFYRDRELVNVESIEVGKKDKTLLKVSDPWDGQAF